MALEAGFFGAPGAHNRLILPHSKGSSQVCSAGYLDAQVSYRSTASKLRRYSEAGIPWFEDIGVVRGVSVVKCSKAWWSGVVKHASAGRSAGVVRCYV